MKKKIILIGGVAILIILVFVGLRWGGQEGNSEETAKEKYLRQEETIMNKANITEDELEEDLLELVSLGRNELGHWKEREESWVVKAGPDYQDYAIDKEEDYEELVKRISIFVVEGLYKHMEKDRSFSVSKKLVKKRIRNSFDKLIIEEDRLVKGLFKKI